MELFPVYSLGNYVMAANRELLLTNGKFLAQLFSAKTRYKQRKLIGSASESECNALLNILHLIVDGKSIMFILCS
jgi:hypothetical protein